MPDHDIASAFYDEDWTVTCTCGLSFHGRYRADLEAEQRKHAGLAQVEAIRSELGGDDTA